MNVFNKNIYMFGGNAVKLGSMVVLLAHSKKVLGSIPRDTQLHFCLEFAHFL